MLRILTRSVSEGYTPGPSLTLRVSMTFFVAGGNSSRPASGVGPGFPRPRGGQDRENETALNQGRSSNDTLRTLWRA